MNYRTINSIPIGDIQAFKKMLADAVKNPDNGSQHTKDYRSNIPYNDERYQSVTADVVDK